MKDLLDAIYPRSDRSDYVVRLEPIQTTNKAVFQYIATEEELARYPSHTTRCAQTNTHKRLSGRLFADPSLSAPQRQGESGGVGRRGG